MLITLFGCVAARFVEYYNGSYDIAINVYDKKITFHEGVQQIASNYKSHMIGVSLKVFCDSRMLAIMHKEVAGFLELIGRFLNKLKNKDQNSLNDVVVSASNYFATASSNFKEMVEKSNKEEILVGAKGIKLILKTLLACSECLLNGLKFELLLFTLQIAGIFCGLLGDSYEIICAVGEKLFGPKQIN